MKAGWLRRLEKIREDRALKLEARTLERASRHLGSRGGARWLFTVPLVLLERAEPQPARDPEDEWLPSD
ncbi:MAG: hypothetical protein HKP27_05275 [Myxococcales bacterium]|nr:hypothetical protein [Myxococcales bacterium]